MKRAILFIAFILGLSPLMLNAQNAPTFSDQEMASFAQVYLSSKPKNIGKRNSGIITLLNQHNVSHKRYKEIIATGVNSENITLTEKEELLMEDIKKQNAKLQAEKIAQVKANCTKLNLDYKKYEDMLFHYKKDIDFQRNLMPFLEEAIRKQGK